VFLTDQDGSIPELDLTHRGHARVEDRIREGKELKRLRTGCFTGQAGSPATPASGSCASRADWAWSGQLTEAFAALHALPPSA
jgi:hypothetical protein